MICTAMFWSGQALGIVKTTTAQENMRAKFFMEVAGTIVLTSLVLPFATTTVHLFVATVTVFV